MVLLCSALAGGCSPLPAARDLLSPTPMVLSSGLRLREVRWAGRRVLVQLPPCYTPGGLLHDFEGGVRMRLRPTTARGKADVQALRLLCASLLAADARGCDGQGCDGQGCGEQGGRGPSNIAPDGDELLVRSRRGSDLRFFESVGVASPPEAATALPGETLSALISVEYAWAAPEAGAAGCAAAGGGSAAAAKCGVYLKLVQVLIHTDRQRFRECLVAPLEALEPRTGRARAPDCGGSGLQEPTRQPQPREPQPGEPQPWEAQPRRAPTRLAMAAVGFTPPSREELVGAIQRLRKRGAGSSAADL